MESLFWQNKLSFCFSKNWHLCSAGELQPATAFMTGKLKLSGDLAKALSLEAVMKASREARLAKEAADGKRGFHTSAGRST